MRDDEWLISRLFLVWNSWFSDVEMKNKIIAKFKGRWKNKFGHIKMKSGITEIAVNGLFRNEEIPEEIVDLTIAHEICHYSHGFQSPLERKFLHPHKGGVVRKELTARGLRNALRREKEFVKEWGNVYEKLTGRKFACGRRNYNFYGMPAIKVRHFGKLFGF